MHDPLATALSLAVGRRVHDDRRRVSGGSIHEAFAYRTAGEPIFVKVCDLADAALLTAEAEGLQALANANAVRVPAVIALGETAQHAFICLEWMELTGASSRAEARLGERLAALHGHTGSAHGWPRDNFIGRTPQLNTQCRDWLEFFRDRRLRPQLQLAARNAADARTIDGGHRLCESLSGLFADYRPQPSLLHGDLWGGNWSSLHDGEPVMFDPAVYYGDRETDLAMTRLFGGFGPSFYRAYEAAWPLDADAATRVPLYNLYHVLNHFNLFGGAYLSQARASIERLLAQIKA